MREDLSPLRSRLNLSLDPRASLDVARGSRRRSHAPAPRRTPDPYIQGPDLSAGTLDRTSSKSSSDSSAEPPRAVPPRLPLLRRFLRLFLAGPRNLPSIPLRRPRRLRQPRGPLPRTPHRGPPAHPRPAAAAAGPPRRTRGRPGRAGRVPDVGGAPPEAKAELKGWPGGRGSRPLTRPVCVGEGAARRGRSQKGGSGSATGEERASGAPDPRGTVEEDTGEVGRAKGSVGQDGQ